jgi:hypothetical protein
MNIEGRFNPKRVTIEVAVIRADGSVDNLGTVSDSDWKIFSPGRLRALWRTNRANRRAKGT